MAYSAALQGDVAAGPDRGLEESDCDGPDMSGNGTYDETVLSDEDLAVAVRVIRSLAPEGREISELWRTPRLKPLRSAIVALVDELKSRTKSDHLEVIAQNKAKKREAHAKLQQQRAFDRQAVEKTRMRAERMAMLNALKDEDGRPRAPDGAVGMVDGMLLTSLGSAQHGTLHHSQQLALEGSERSHLADSAAAAREGDGADLPAAASAAAPAPLKGEACGDAAVLGPHAERNELLSGASAQSGPSCAVAACSTTPLLQHRSCYICKARYRDLHSFYASLCPACATLNYAKRVQTPDLSRRTVLITGARVKIGFQAALRLLRCGAVVLATSRFPVDTAARFAALPDFTQWAHRLQVFGLDLRDLRALERFCDFLAHTHEHITDIVNNACQTIRRPKEYYAHLLRAELSPDSVPAEQQRLLQSNLDCFGSMPSLQQLESPLMALEGGTGSMVGAAATALDRARTGFARGGREVLLPSALWSQVQWDGEEEQEPTDASAPSGADEATAAPQAAASCSRAEGDGGVSSVVERGVQGAAGASADKARAASSFPVGLRDVNGQQLDLRSTNSWLLKLHEVGTSEAAEVLAINTLAPFIINSRLQQLLERAPVEARCVVNVSAMEGKFYRYKTPNHPHTNMAKAALNMMTRTCAEDLAKRRIFMNSVDTGWINDENPLERAAATASTGFQTPLDEIDAAARIVDPLMIAGDGGTPPHGKFLKNYEPCEW